MEVIFKKGINRVPIKSWVTEIEEGAMKQAFDLSNLPFAFKHVALMPDCHQGYGMPIGGVLATKGVVVPNAVGVDIGCGMLAAKTNLTELTVEQIKTILGGSKENKGGIRGKIPVGFNHHKKSQSIDWFLNFEYTSVVGDQAEKAMKQIGTLGGGNHFIEIQKGSDGHIWIMIHSGSRNLGYTVAKHYNSEAQRLCEKYYSDIPNNDLAFLPMDTCLYNDYLNDMNFCLYFAKANRFRMLDRILEAFNDVVLTDTADIINIHHNYAAMENHFGSNVMVHRKGATSAQKGRLGIIPGSQGTKSYIVRGLGNPESFMSCSHGAGRLMSRKKAQENLNLEDEIKKMNDQGIVHGLRNKCDLDEAAGAYKDIDAVMENQKDLVEILVELKPLAVLKG